MGRWRGDARPGSIGVGRVGGSAFRSAGSRHAPSAGSVQALRLAQDERARETGRPDGGPTWTELRGLLGWCTLSGHKRQVVGGRSLSPPEWVEWVEEPVAGYPKRPVPNAAAPLRELGRRTLTNLYNERPQWLEDAHKELDAAVAAAYGWPDNIAGHVALKKLLSLNLTSRCT